MSKSRAIHAKLFICAGKILSRYLVTLLPPVKSLLVAALPRCASVVTTSQTESTDDLSRGLFADFYCGRLQLEVVQNDRGEDDAGDAHQALPDDQTKQGEPKRVADSFSDDLAVEEVLKL